MGKGRLNCGKCLSFKVEYEYGGGKGAVTCEKMGHRACPLDSKINEIDNQCQYNAVNGKWHQLDFID